MRHSLEETKLKRRICGEEKGEKNPVKECIDSLLVRIVL